MKKFLCGLLTLALLIVVMSACGGNPTGNSSAESSLSASSAFTPSGAASLANTSTVNTSSASGYDSYFDLDDIDFSVLAGMTFWFLSGAGAWSTYVQIQPDGSFVGYYHDSDAGSRVECFFNGEFTALKKTGLYEYSMKCESLHIKGTLGEKKVIDGITVTTVEPYGFDNADLFYVYLPGKKLSGLPLEFKQWVHVPWEDPENSDGYSSWIADYGDALTCYGLYNVSEKEGFSTDGMN